MKDHLISRSKFLDALVLDADHKTDLIQVHHALEKAVVEDINVPSKDVVPMDFHERCLQLEIKKRIELEKQLPHWISVEERLPELGQGVLVYDDCEYMSVADYTHDKHFPTVYEFHVNGEYEPGVTHWMPLPAPPEEDE